MNTELIQVILFSAFGLMMVFLTLYFAYQTATDKT